MECQPAAHKGETESRADKNQSKLIAQNSRIIFIISRMIATINIAKALKYNRLLIRLSVLT
jgi:hypothetical protein